MKILVYDTTPQKKSFLDELWKIGAWLAKSFGRFDHKVGSDSWPDAIDKILKISEGKTIDELHYWGHGHWGQVYMGKHAITSSALCDPSHPWYAKIVELSSRFTRSSLVWFRVCSLFANNEGHMFAIQLSDLFGCRCISSTHIIHLIHSGLHSIHPAQTPYWDVKEGVKRFPEANVETGFVQMAEKPKYSWFRNNWIMFWTSRIPDLW